MTIEYTQETIKTAKALKKQCGRISAPLFQRKFQLDFRQALDLVDFINRTGVYAK